MWVWVRARVRVRARGEGGRRLAVWSGRAYIKLSTLEARDARSVGLRASKPEMPGLILGNSSTKGCAKLSRWLPRIVGGPSACDVRDVTFSLLDARSPMAIFRLASRERWLKVLTLAGPCGAGVPDSEPDGCVQGELMSGEAPPAAGWYSACTTCCPDVDGRGGGGLSPPSSS